ncbi:NmrA family NAD(P)-binding protein [Streptomyces sp. NPDC020681]|uniref:NmrA family NAD(P)-binding protein n=1 Tax=Streptomyces sp. NPDC020681 TaxID=3365083 RepID=UPI003792CC06
MTENLKQETVLVTAATGKTGHRVAERLAARGVQVRAGSRKGEVVFDWENQSTWAPALRGADAAYVTYFPDLAGPGAVEAMQAFGLAAAGSGVGRLVLLSGRGEPDAVTAESALRAAGVDLTVVRASFFAQNFSEGPMAAGVAEGAVVFPAGGTAEPFIDADDLADVMVAALTEPGHVGQTYEVTGSRLLTFEEVAAEIGRAAGRDVRYLAVSGEEYKGMLQEAGFPAPDAEWLVELFTMLMDGHNASVTDGVRQILGREPRDFTLFAQGAAAAGAWG